MARKHKTNAGKKTNSSGDYSIARRCAVRRALAWVMLAVVISAAVVFGMKTLENRVLLGPAGEAVADYRISLSPRPAWMPVSVAAELARSLRPRGVQFHETALTKTIYDRAQTNTWIRRVVEVSKGRTEDPQMGIVRVQAEFRQPIASVSSSGQVRREYVDAEGVRLPASGVPMWAAVIPPTDDSELARQVYFVDREDIPPGLQARPIHYIRIDGVRELPPRQVGQCWKGDDLAAGLKLVKLIRTRPYANQITTVDVGNHARRALPSEPELRMYAQVGKGRPTDIRFGRFSVPGVRDFNIAAERKMSYLDQYVQENNGHLAGINSFIDLRYDDLTYSLN